MYLCHDIKLPILEHKLTTILHTHRIYNTHDMTKLFASISKDFHTSFFVQISNVCNSLQ